VPYRLLTEFDNLFNDHLYRHRDSSLGDVVAMHLYEDLVILNRSTKFAPRVESKEWVLNTANRRQGSKLDVVTGHSVKSSPPRWLSRTQVS
jgi:hypothetical protein